MSLHEMLGLFPTPHRAPDDGAGGGDDAADAAQPGGEGGATSAAAARAPSKMVTSRRMPRCPQMRA